MIPVRKSVSHKFNIKLLLVILIVGVFLYKFLTRNLYRSFEPSAAFASVRYNSKDIAKRKLGIIAANNTILDKADDYTLKNNLKEGNLVEPRKDNLQLIGTVVSNIDKFNVAIIKNSNNERQSVYHKGSQLPGGARIKNIFRNHILLEKDGKEEILEMTMTPDRGKIELNSRGYQKISSNEWVISPEKVFKSAENIVKLCWDTDIKVDEKGFKIEQIPDNEFLRELGLQEGDIIKEINGQKFDSIYDALAYIWELGDESSMDIKIIRDQKESSLLLHPYYDGIPSYVETGSITPDRISAILTTQAVTYISNLVYK